MQANEIHPIIQKLLIKRNYNQDQFNDFFSWNLNELPDLESMLDLDKTANRIIAAINNNQKIAIYGDYDVDGTTSCALFYHFFKMINYEVVLYQPSRFIEGYGIHPSSIDKAVEDQINLVITVDCGITNSEACDYAKQVGIDLIITDHHTDACETMPDAYAIVNPNRRDETHKDLKKLAGVGVAFAVCLKIKKLLEEQGKTIPSIYPLLQFVAVGTICDLAYLNPMNLKLVRHGLKQIPSSTYTGLRAFLTPEEKSLEFLPSEKLAFYIGPHINSKGRLEHPDAALKLLINNDDQESYLLFSQLEICNRERKFIQNDVFEEAKRQVIKNIDNDDMKINIVYSPDWHEGVIGIVASKLVETFGVPAIVFTNSEDKDVLKASARSAGDLNLFDQLKKCEEFFTKFGGHKAAAGLSMPKENLTPFKEKMNALLSDIPQIQRTKQDEYDLSINIEDINLKLIKNLDLLEPFGMGNSKPVFRMTNIKIEKYQVLKDKHLKWTFVSNQNSKIKVFGITFFYFDKWDQLPPEELFRLQDEEGLTIQFTIGINRFNGNEYIQLMVDKLFLGNKAH